MHSHRILQMREASHVEGLFPMWAKHTVGTLLFINMLSQYFVAFFFYVKLLFLSYELTWHNGQLWEQHWEQLLSSHRCIGCLLLHSQGSRWVNLNVLVSFFFKCLALFRRASFWPPSMAYVIYRQSHIFSSVTKTSF